MLAELPLTALATYAARFAEPAARLASSSIAAGNTAGRLWSANAHDPAATLVLWDQGNNILYLGLSPGGDEAALRELVNGELRSAALAGGLERFGVRALDPAPDAALTELLANLLSGERRSMFWEYPAGREPAAQAVSIAELRWEPIDRQLLGRDDISGLSEVRNLPFTVHHPSFQILPALHSESRHGPSTYRSFAGCALPGDSAGNSWAHTGTSRP